MILISRWAILARRNLAADRLYGTNKPGTGEYLQLEFEIIEGEYRNRKVWTRLNINNPNPDAVRMAQADLSAICHAVNVIQPGAPK